MFQEREFPVFLIGSKEENIRAGDDEITVRRGSGNTSILLTGATGFLGIHLAESLVIQGYSVYLLVRPLDNLSPEARIDELFDLLDMDHLDRSRIRIVSGDLNRPDLGLPPENYSELASTVDEIIHCASETSFSERKRPQIEKANIENLQHLLDFASRSGCFFFHFISTAYVAGKKSGTCPEDLVETRSFFNAYEETKYRAERIAAEHCSYAGIPLNIYRPSIVYGDSRTGKTLRFNAMYYPVRILVFLRNLYNGNKGEPAEKGAGKMGISFDRKGVAHMPMRIETAASRGINLIPIDFFTAAFSAIMEAATDGGVFHITHQRVKPISDLIDYAQEYFKIKGIQAVRPEDFSSGSQNRLEILFNRYTEVYKPYMKDERIFDNSKAAGILDERGISCPDFDYRIFSTCMQYAEAVNWGNAALNEKIKQENG